MPPRIEQDRYTKRIGGLLDVNYKYKYPRGLNLHPKSDLHKELISMLSNAAHESRSEISKRYPSWRAIDRTNRAFIDLESAEQAIKWEDKKKPVNLVVPMSYAMEQTLIAHTMNAFIKQPFIRYKGVGREDAIGAALLTKMVDMHCVRNVLLSFIGCIKSIYRYGMGAGHVRWDIARDGFEGNALDVIDPYLYLPDPRVARGNIQRGSYVGWVEMTSLRRLQRQEIHDKSMFNVKYLNHCHGASVFANSPDDRGETVSARTTILGPDDPVDVVWLIMDIIPYEFKLGKKKTPELWTFGMANDILLLKAGPLRYDHNMYPVIDFGLDLDGITQFPMSSLEVVNGLQIGSDFFFNSHLHAVRQGVNNWYVVNPSIVDTSELDMTSSKGGFIFLRRNAFGRSAKDALYQVPLNDVTRNNVYDLGAVIELAQRATGASDPIQGIPRRTSERVTATEAGGIMSSGMLRISKDVTTILLSAHMPLGMQCAYLTKQFTTHKGWIEIFGEDYQDLRREFGANVGQKFFTTPDMINVNTDITYADLETQSDTNAWLQLMTILSTNPVMYMSDQQAPDMLRIFLHVARLLGARNAQDFIKTPNMNAQVQPDEQVMNNLSRGNVVPIEDLATTGVEL